MSPVRKRPNGAFLSPDFVTGRFGHSRVWTCGMNPFDYSESPTSAMLEHMQRVRAAAKDLASVILEIPNSRERSLALTNLEQAAMWANKSITHGTQGQAPR